MSVALGNLRGSGAIDAGAITAGAITTSNFGGVIGNPWYQATGNTLNLAAPVTGSAVFTASQLG